MKILILILNHLPLEDTLFHYNWHNQICDTKVIWQTDQKISHPDFSLIDVPGKMIIANVTRLLSFYAAKFPEYDYYCFLAGDCFIIKKDFIIRTINTMAMEKADACFCDIQDRLEHYKCLHYDLITSHYGIKWGNIKWSLNACTILKKECALFYNEKNWYKIYDEIDFVNLIGTKYKCIVNPYINYNYFNANEIFLKINKEKHIKSLREIIKDVYIIHAIKDYKRLEERGIVLK